MEAKITDMKRKHCELSHRVLKVRLYLFWRGFKRVRLGKGRLPFAKFTIHHFVSGYGKTRSQQKTWPGRSG